MELTVKTVQRYFLTGARIMVETRVVYLEPGKLTIKTIPLPDLKPGQVLIKAHQASVCGSERYHYRGINVRPQDEAKGGPEFQLGGRRKQDGPEHVYPMGPLGHEGGGTIVEMGSAVEVGASISLGSRTGVGKLSACTVAVGTGSAWLDSTIASG